LNERDATTLWRKLFNGKEVSPESLTEARALLNQLNPESPLQVRFAAELEELQKIRQKQRSKTN